MAMAKGEPCEKLPPAPTRTPRLPLERQRSCLSQCTYATNVCAPLVCATSLFDDISSCA